MELLNLKFAVLLIKLTLCILPFIGGVKLLFFVNSRQKIRQKISKQVLGEPELLEAQVFNFFYNATILFLLAFGGLLTFILFIL